ncbi:MAG: hypothetical protein V2I48_01085 [Xanthomonadales bacterium]|jgi:hypothetical protein|nr:hypothetical protein [Xanthomonadales bacterium]
MPAERGGFRVQRERSAAQRLLNQVLPGAPFQKRLFFAGLGMAGSKQELNVGAALAAIFCEKENRG